MEINPLSKQIQGHPKISEEKVSKTDDTISKKVDIPINKEVFIKEALMDLGLSFDENNMELILALINNDLPITEENINKLNQILKYINFKLPDSENSENLLKGIFLLKNEFPANKINSLNKFLEKDNSLSKNLENIIEEIYIYKDENIKNEILDILLSTPEIKKDIAKDLDLFIKNSPIENTGDTEILENIINKNLDIPILKELIKYFESENKDTKINTDIPKLKEFIIILEDNPEILNIKNQKDLEILLDKLEILLKEISKEEIMGLVKLMDRPIEEIIRDLKTPKEFKDIEPKDIIKKFALEDLEKQENIDVLLNDIDKKMEKILKTLEDEDAPEITNNIEKLKENLKFTNEIKSSVYIPIPINTGEGIVEGELYIFKDKREKGKKGSSALIGLNTVNLGRIESYIIKEDRSLNIQFRLENMESKKIISDNIAKLNNLLSEKNLIIKSIGIISMDFPFNILETEPNKKRFIDIENILFDEKA